MAGLAAAEETWGKSSSTETAAVANKGRRKKKRKRKSRGRNKGSCVSRFLPTEQTKVRADSPGPARWLPSGLPWLRPASFESGGGTDRRQTRGKQSATTVGDNRKTVHNCSTSGVKKTSSPTAGCTQPAHSPRSDSCTSDLRLD